MSEFYIIVKWRQVPKIIPTQQFSNINGIGLKKTSKNSLYLGPFWVNFNTLFEKCLGWYSIWLWIKIAKFGFWNSTSWPRRCRRFKLQLPIRRIRGRGIFFKWMLHHISFKPRQCRGQLVTPPKKFQISKKAKKNFLFFSD